MAAGPIFRIKIFQEELYGCSDTRKLNKKLNIHIHIRLVSSFWFYVNF